MQEGSEYDQISLYEMFKALVILTKCYTKGSNPQTRFLLADSAGLVRKINLISRIFQFWSVKIQTLVTHFRTSFISRGGAVFNTSTQEAEEEAVNLLSSRLSLQF